jgi:DHA1 family bicyclomycin/chloramphenicol resistance-like MFS transporter
MTSKKMISPNALACLLALCSAVGPFTTEMYLPSFHDMAAVFGQPLAAVQQTLTAYLLGFCCMMPFYGMMSDVIGRRLSMLLGFLGYTISSICVAYSPDLYSVMFFRALQGVFAGCGVVVGTAMVRDLYSGEQAQKVFSYIAMVFGVGPAIAPIAGGFLATNFPWYSHFYFLTALGVLLVALCYFFLPESLPKSHRVKVNFVQLMENYGKVLADRSFMFGALSCGLGFGGQAVYIAGAADWCSVVRGLSLNQFWYMFLPMVTGQVLGSMVSPRLAHLFSLPATIRIGFGISVLASLLAAGIILSGAEHSLFVALMPLVIYAFGLSVMRPTMNLFVMDVFPQMRGLASSMLNFIQTLLFALTSAVVVPLVYGKEEFYLFALIGFTAVSLIFWVTRGGNEAHRVEKAGK